MKLRRYTPDGGTLALASQDDKIYLYDVMNGYLCRGAFEKHNSFITHIDFSKDSQYVDHLKSLIKWVSRSNPRTRLTSVPGLPAYRRADTSDLTAERWSCTSQMHRMGCIYLVRLSSRM